MTAPHIIDPAGLLGQALGDASPDLMRHLLSTVINALLSSGGIPEPVRQVQPPAQATHPKRAMACATSFGTGVSCCL
ncbi:hypothetical protein GCM10009827_057060 [Dactylosporangium maewongense]|uniref:Uncharacterized protein n=1 Tax=Dactylosporangium maewongense TaxID=634393 RepID=A0ABN2B338_9ACTN